MILHFWKLKRKEKEGGKRERAGGEGRKEGRKGKEGRKEGKNFDRVCMCPHCLKYLQSVLYRKH